MITEITFGFDELIIDRTLIIKSLGYNEDSFPDPFPGYLDEAMQDCFQLPDIRGAYRIVDQVEMLASKKSVFADGLEFKVGKTIRDELNDATRLAFFVCTAGKTISEKSEQLLKGDDPVLGYVYDVLGSAIAEAVGDQIQQSIRQEVEKDGDKITNRYSPGYCHWNVADQHKLFSLFNESPCGISLTPSALMHPVKSISGVIGIGGQVSFHDYQCSLCNLDNCVYREMHRL